MKKIVVAVFTFLLSLNFLSAEKIIFSANSMTGKTGDASTTNLTGTAYVKTSSMEISADSIELSGDEYRYIKATGTVSGKNLDTNMEFTCNSLEYDRTTKVAELKGSVNLTDKDNDVKAQSQIIIYDQSTDIAVLQISVNLTQKDNVCSGSYAVYYKKNQLLELSGNAQVRQKDDVFRAQFITLDMDTQDITLGGNVKGTVTDTKEPESQATDAENAENGAPANAELEQSGQNEVTAEENQTVADGDASTDEETADESSQSVAEGEAQVADGVTGNGETSAVESSSETQSVTESSEKVKSKWKSKKK